MLRMLDTWEPVYFKPELMSLLRLKTVTSVQKPTAVVQQAAPLQQPVQPQSQPWLAPAPQGLQLTAQQQLQWQIQQNQLLQQLIMQQSNSQQQKQPPPLSATTSLGSPVFVPPPTMLQALHPPVAAPAPMDPRLQQQQRPYTTQQTFFAPAAQSQVLPGPPPFPPPQANTNYYSQIGGSAAGSGVAQQFSYPGPPSLNQTGIPMMLTQTGQAQAGSFVGSSHGAASTAQVGSSMAAQPQVGTKRPREVSSQTLKVMRNASNIDFGVRRAVNRACASHRRRRCITTCLYTCMRTPLHRALHFVTWVCPARSRALCQESEVQANRSSQCMVVGQSTWKSVILEHGACITCQHASLSPVNVRYHKILQCTCFVISASTVCMPAFNASAQSFYAQPSMHLLTPFYNIYCITECKVAQAVILVSRCVCLDDQGRTFGLVSLVLWLQCPTFAVSLV